jgi:cell cycle sensor histidine kinase DivJ
VNLSTPIHDFLDTLVHPSAREDPLTAERHLAFMVTRLFASLIALGAFPVFLALRGVPSALEFFVLAWMIVPISTACFLSCTGRYDAAQSLSAFALTGIVTTLAANSGGSNSSAAMWLALIPLEAALSGSRRVVALAALFAIGGAGILMLAGWQFNLGSGVERSTGAVTALGILSALFYATGTAFGADPLAWANVGRQAEQRRLSCSGTTDVITYHGHGGRVVYASANALTVLGAPACELRHYGLFDRIHIADRPAYLHALSEAAATGDTCEIEFRLRQAAQASFIWIEMRCRHFDRHIDREAVSPQVVAVMRDVTLRKTQQEALIVARAEAERANTAKSRFLAITSHELRTPLNAIIGFSDMLRTETETELDSACRLEYARLINESGHHLLALVDEIFDMSRLEAGDFAAAPESFRRGAVIDGFPTSGQPVDPSTPRRAPMNHPANLTLSVQKRA